MDGFLKAFEEDHAPEAAAELMCNWAVGSSKLVRPLSGMLLAGIESSSYTDVDTWMGAIRRWLEVEDTLQVKFTCYVNVAAPPPPAPAPQVEKDCSGSQETMTPHESYT